MIDTVMEENEREEYIKPQVIRSEHSVCTHLS